MKIKSIPLTLFTLALLALASCRQEDGSPIRNVRFDPSLLNQAMDGTPCTSYSYFYNDEPRTLGTAYTKQIVVAFAAGSTHKEQKSITANYGFVKGIKGQTMANGEVLYTLELEDGLNCKQTERAIQVLMQSPLVTYAAPYFVKNNNLLGVSNEVRVTLNTAGDRSSLDRLIQAYKATVVSEVGHATYLVRVDKNSTGNALELANYLQEQESVASAEPDFILSLDASTTVADRRKSRASYSPLR